MSHPTARAELPTRGPLALLCLATLLAAGPAEAAPGASASGCRSHGCGSTTPTTLTTAASSS